MYRFFTTKRNFVRDFIRRNPYKYGPECRGNRGDFVLMLLHLGS